MAREKKTAVQINESDGLDRPIGCERIISARSKNWPEWALRTFCPPTNRKQRAILGVIAIAVGLRTHGKFLIEHSEDELLEMEP